MDPIAESPGDALTKLLQEPKTTHHPSSPPRGHHRNKLRPHHQIPLRAQTPNLLVSGNILTSRRCVPSALQPGNQNDSRRRVIVELLDSSLPCSVEGISEGIHPLGSYLDLAVEPLEKRFNLAETPVDMET